MGFRRISHIVSLVLIMSLLALPITAIAQDSVHIVQPGENLYRISLQYGISMESIAQANNLSNQARILSGQQLVIPDLTGAVVTDLFAPEPSHHVVQPGETLASIANLYGITVEQISQINNIANPDRIFRGETLTVFTQPVTALTLPEPETEIQAAVDETVNVEPTAIPFNAENGTPYVIQPGEHLAEIAQRYGISWPALVQVNNIVDPNRIEAGQTILIPQAGTIRDLGIVTPLVEQTAAPAATIGVGKQIIVDLSDSRIFAYEDGTLVRNVVVSTGLPATPTVQGNFTVERKYESQLMSGPGYYLPNVQWIMYFYSGYAIHGTYWHNNFGQPMSHGCVNLPNDEALWFYQWAPAGTPVLVQV